MAAGADWVRTWPRTVATAARLLQILAAVEKSDFPALWLFSKELKTPLVGKTPAHDTRNISLDDIMTILLAIDEAMPAIVSVEHYIVQGSPGRRH
jgi:hypothetical protein